MPHRLILKVTKFQLPPPKRLGTVVKNILGGHHCPPPCQIGLSCWKIFGEVSGNFRKSDEILIEAQFCENQTKALRLKI